MHREIMENLDGDHPELLTTAIPYASDIERMGPERMPLGAYVKKSPSTVAYQQLWREILARITDTQ
ncbi:MAG: ParA family protein, partial [Methylovulum sp.]